MTADGAFTARRKHFQFCCDIAAARENKYSLGVIHFFGNKLHLAVVQAICMRKNRNLRAAISSLRKNINGVINVFHLIFLILLVVISQRIRGKIRRKTLQLSHYHSALCKKHITKNEPKHLFKANFLLFNVRRRLPADMLGPQWAGSANSDRKFAGFTVFKVFGKHVGHYRKCQFRPRNILF